MRSRYGDLRDSRTIVVLVYAGTGGEWELGVGLRDPKEFIHGLERKS